MVEPRFDELVDAARSVFWAVDPLHVADDMQFTYDEYDSAAAMSVTLVLKYRRLKPSQIIQKLDDYFFDYFGVEVRGLVVSVVNSLLEKLES